jgi:hypothetical protein
VFSDLQASSGDSVILANKHVLAAVGRSHILLILHQSKRRSFGLVLCVPGLDRNLFSIEQIAFVNHLIVQFKDGKCLVINKNNDVISIKDMVMDYKNLMGSLSKTLVLEMNLNTQIYPKLKIWHE